MSRILVVFRGLVRYLGELPLPRVVALAAIAAGVPLMLAAPGFGQTVTAFGAMVTLAESVLRLLDTDRRRLRRAPSRRS